jgi:glycosyltransferase involved in cell wall biosynthesis
MVAGISIAELDNLYPGRIGVQQRLLPVYRVEFFERLAGACSGGLSLFAGEPGLGEALVTTQTLNQASFAFAHNWHLGRVDSQYYLLWQKGIKAWLAHWQPDALILEANPRYLASRQAIRWMHARQRPVIGWGLGAPPFGSKGMFTAFQRRFRKGFLLSFDALIVYSQRGFEEYRSLGFPDDKIYIARNAVKGRPKELYKERSLNPGSTPTILFVGRLQGRKRIDNLIRACSNLPVDIQPDVWIVGDGPARADFERLAQEIYPRARFFGTLHGPQLAAKFNQADLFVLPGTGGLAVQEAMAYGLPVIVAEGDGTQDDLVRPENGWQVAPDDLSELQNAIYAALANPDRLRKMGRESFRIVSQEINVETMVSVFVEALNNTKVA